MSERYQEIRKGWCPPDLTFDELAAMCREWQAEGQSIVFTNGCFDVLHEGHLELFAAALEKGERLVIGVNTDEWVAKHKGNGRPLQSATIRRAVAHCMAQADLSIIFEDETAERLLSIVRPTTYIIGSDYRDRKILGAEYCGEVIIIDRLAGFSTTGLIVRASNATTVQQFVNAPIVTESIESQRGVEQAHSKARCFFRNSTSTAR